MRRDEGRGRQRQYITRTETRTYTEEKHWRGLAVLDTEGRRPTVRRRFEDEGQVCVLLKTINSLAINSKTGSNCSNNTNIYKLVSTAACGLARPACLVIIFFFSYLQTSTGWAECSLWGNTITRADLSRITVACVTILVNYLTQALPTNFSETISNKRIF